jgi:hypothetical protein
MMLLITVAVFAVFHSVLVYALITRRINALYFVAASFCFIAPVSTASFLENTTLFKYGRVYVSVLIVVLGFMVLRLYRYGPASMTFFAFIALYVLGALWSDEPLMGVLYKGLFGAVFLSGVMLAFGTRDHFDLRIGLRILTIAGAAFAVFILMELVRNPDAIARHLGRLFAFGINPNRIGHTSAPLLIVASAVALHDTSRIWRQFGYAVIGLLAIVILYTGSRGAFGMAMIGTTIVAFPTIKRPGLFLSVATFVGAVVFFGLGIIAEGARSRLFLIHGDIRKEMREAAWAYFVDAPVFGQGWVYNVGVVASTRNMHSVYGQVLAELGAVGFTLFWLTIFVVGVMVLRSWKYVIQVPQCVGYGYLMLGLFTAIFAHAFVESATFVGTTVNAMMLGWAIGMIDRMKEIAFDTYQQELPWQMEYLEAGDDEPESDLTATAYS